MHHPFNRSERVWIDVTRDRDELGRRLISAQNEIDRLTAFLTILASPVPFSALADTTLREMGKEFADRLSLAQQALRGAAVPKPPIAEYASDRVFDGIRLISDEGVEKLKENFERTHGEDVAVPNGDRA